jgi:hypothetical protein
MMTLGDILAGYPLADGSSPSLADIVSDYWVTIQSGDGTMTADELNRIELLVAEAAAVLEGKPVIRTDDNEPIEWTSVDIVFAITDRGDPSTVRDLIEQMARTATDQHQIELLGAGPLQDLLYDRGDEFLETLEDLARKWPTVRAALAYVWQDELDRSRVQWLNRFSSPPT